MPENSFSTRLALEMLIFVLITYVSIFIIYGDSLLSNLSFITPNSPFNGIPVLNVFGGIINFMIGFFMVVWSLFTFNIPGLPMELRALFSFLYIGMGIVIVLVFYTKIANFFIAVINAFILIYNLTIANVPIPLVGVLGKMDYLSFMSG